MSATNSTRSNRATRSTSIRPCRTPIGDREGKRVAHWSSRRGDSAPGLHPDADQLAARRPEPPHRIVPEPGLHREPRVPEEQLHLTWIVNVAVEVADVALDLAAVRKLVV